MKSPDDRTQFVEGPAKERQTEMLNNSHVKVRGNVSIGLTRRLEMSFGLWSDATVPKIVGYN